MKKNLRKVLLALLCAAALLTGCTREAAPTQSGTAPAPTHSGTAPVPSEQENSEGPVPPAEEQSYDYRENADGSLTITGYRGSESSLEIPAVLEGRPVTGIGEGCFAGALCLQRVRVPEGVEQIGAYAFECCSALRKIYLPDSLRGIGDGAFSGCGLLSLVDLQDGVESIGRGAFLCCDSLVQMELPAALKELGAFAFSGCGALASVRFGGDSLSALPDRLFCGCASLSSLRLPASVSAVGKRSFSGCESLKSLYFAAPLRELGSYAFEDCSQLSGVWLQTERIPEGVFSGCAAMDWFELSEGTLRLEAGAFRSCGISTLGIPATVTEIEPGAFFQLNGSVTLDEGNGSYKLIDGSLYTADGKTLLAYFPADPYAEEPQTEFAVPEGVERIAAYALAESGLTTVRFPASLRQIDAGAFAGTSLEDPDIPEGTTVDPAAFDRPEEETEPEPEEPDEETVPETLGSAAGEKSLFREELYAGFREIDNAEFDAWCEGYLAYNEAEGVSLTQETLPYVTRYKGEVVPHFMAMTAVQNRDPGMWADAANFFGDDFEETYLMMDHGLFTELRRGRMEEPLILYSGLYDSQLMAAAGTDTVPTRQQLVDAIGSEFSDPIMISTTTDPGIAANFGDTLFVIYAAPEAMEGLGAICVDAVVHSTEKEILMNANARYRILDVGSMKIETREPWEEEPATVYRSYVKVELLAP